MLALSDTAVVYRRTATSDAGGGASWAWATVGTAACRVDGLGAGAGRLVGGALSEHTTHECTLPLGTDVDTPDRVVVTGRGTFEVTAAPRRTAEMARVIEVMQV